jgi:hypothetical protein
VVVFSEENSSNGTWKEVKRILSERLQICEEEDIEMYDIEGLSIE